MEGKFYLRNFDYVCREFSNLDKMIGSILIELKPQEKIKVGYKTTMGMGQVRRVIEK